MSRALRNVLAPAALLMAVLVALSAASAQEQSDCASGPRVLWGDGEHDDTAALNAWFRGDAVVWADTHKPVGAEIADRTFLLSSTVYVSGGTIATGSDPDAEPRTEGITKIGADSDEGVPYTTPDPEPRDHGVPKHCLTS